MTEKEIQAWRLIVNTLSNYGLYDLLKEEISTVADCLRRNRQ